MLRGAKFRLWSSKFEVTMANGGTDGWTEGRLSGNSPLYPTGHRPFGASAQKRCKWEKNIEWLKSKQMVKEANEKESK